MKNNILLFLKLPPPLTGATLMNKYVAESKVLLASFNVKIIPISYKEKIEDTRVLSLRKIVVIFKLYYQLIKALIFFRPKFVYFQVSPLGMAFFRDCTYIFIMKLLGSQILYHLHGKGIHEEVIKSKFKKLLYSWAFNKSSVICLSESLSYDIADVYHSNCFFVNNAIEQLGVLVQTKQVPSDTYRILFLSNLIVSKGIFVYLDAIAIFKKKHSNFNAIIVGKEADIDAGTLQAEIDQRELSDCVQYIGPKYNNDKYDIFRNTDVLVYPTYNDVWGLVILEAMQFGLPVIASKEGAIPEIVDDGITGYLVDKKSPKQIAEKLETFFENRELLKVMGDKGKMKFLEKYTIDKFEASLLKVFNQII